MDKRELKIREKHNELMEIHALQWCLSNLTMGGVDGGTMYYATDFLENWFSETADERWHDQQEQLSRMYGE